MIGLIIGGSGSGKSEFAEDFITKLAKDNLIYIATMQPFSEESLSKIKRHQSLRKNKGFKTIEQYFDLQNIVTNKRQSILLECLGNIVANELFNDIIGDFQIYDKIEKGLLKIMKNTKNLLIVSNDVFRDGIDYDIETKKYIKMLSKLNIMIAKKADFISEIVFGNQINIKNYIEK